ncbi:endonuclease domain-containing protein [Nakamurella sp. PAMC28650]|uniref:endonuclease domain-containing protein n=1 Tax=Nakamurella sp. PAMC28650 TaxID=2762325 RepID=UPI00164E6E8F|nr:DUF559 domain-containing protein [Nakamurella sp. PAMC28650]QNK82228.1 DUF559 domain-containing protein [Nakamurella sp. PAMC28650]
MDTTSPLDARLRRQDMLVTREQALQAGVSRVEIDGHLRRGRWRRILPQVYLVGTAEPSPRVSVRATSLWAGPGAVIVGRAALFWQGRQPTPGPQVEIAVPQRRTGRSPKGVLVHRRNISLEYVFTWQGISIIRTSLAVAELLAQEGQDLLDLAIRRRWTTLQAVQTAHRRRAGHRGAVAGGLIIAAAASGGDSPGERLLHRLLTGAGITGWTANEDVRSGGTVRRPDVRFHRLRLIIEFDGFAFHTDHAVFEDDRRRQNAFVIDGWTILRFTWAQLTGQPEEVVAQIRAALRVASVRSAGANDC